MGLRALAALVLVLPLLGCTASDDATQLQGPTWRSVEVLGDPVTEDPPVTATFAADDTVAGSSGCNRYTGPARVTGDRLEVGPLASTMMACEPTTVMERESAYLQALESADRWERDGDRLRVRDTAGAVVLVFEAD